MDARRFDQLAKAYVAVGSRRSVIAGLLGGVLGLSRIGAGGANHHPRHHCTPSHKHACRQGQTCRKVSGAWTCQQDCLGDDETCQTHAQCCSLCCDTGDKCGNDCGSD
jgi:hypothetical protein